MDLTTTYTIEDQGELQETLEKLALSEKTMFSFGLQELIWMEDFVDQLDVPDWLDPDLACVQLIQKVLRDEVFDYSKLVHAILEYLLGEEPYLDNLSLQVVEVKGKPKYEYAMEIDKYFNQDTDEDIEE